MCGKQLRRKDLQKRLLLAQMHKTSASISRPPTTIPQVLYRKGMTGAVSSKIGAVGSKIGADGSLPVGNTWFGISGYSATSGMRQ